MKRKRNVIRVMPGPAFSSHRLTEQHGVLLDPKERLAYISSPTDYWIFKKRILGGELAPRKRFQLFHRDKDESLHLSTGQVENESERWRGAEEVSTARRFELEDIFGRAERARLEQGQPADRMFQAIALSILAAIVLLVVKVAARGFGPVGAG